MIPTIVNGKIKASSQSATSAKKQTVVNLVSKTPSKPKPLNLAANSIKNI